MKEEDNKTGEVSEEKGFTANKYEKSEFLGNQGRSKINLEVLKDYANIVKSEGVIKMNVTALKMDLNVNNDKTNTELRTKINQVSKQKEIKLKAELDYKNDLFLIPIR